MTRRILFMLVALVVLVTGAPSADQAFRSGVEAVRLDVLVLRNGEPVRGLRAEDFEVRDNGVLQQVDHVSFEKIPLNVVLTLDMSGSLEGTRMQQLQDAAGAMLDGLKEGDQAALVTFSHLVAQRSGLTKDIGAVREAVATMKSFGFTSLIDGAFTGMMLAQSDPDRALEIVFSDGVDTSSWLTASAAIDAAQRSDTVVYCVYAGARRAPRFLQDLAEFTGGQVFENPNAGALRPTFTRILSEFRQRYLVTYSPRDVAPGGWHQLRVSVRNRKLTVKARPGYMRGR